MNELPHFHLRIAAMAILFGVPATGAHAEQATIKAQAKVVKSLSLTTKQDLDFGTIALSGAVGTSTVTLSQAGVLTCTGNVVCSGAPKPAIMNVSGSKSQPVRITVAPSDLTNAVDGTTLRFTPIAPTSLTLTNSGTPGSDFNIGGSVDVPSTADGTYSGNIVVTVDYQ